MRCPPHLGYGRLLPCSHLAASLSSHDLFQTGYISAGLLAEGIFHTGQAGIFGIADQAAFASATFMGLFIGASLAGAAGGQTGPPPDLYGGARLVRSFFRC